MVKCQANYFYAADGTKLGVNVATITPTAGSISSDKTIISSGENVSFSSIEDSNVTTTYQWQSKTSSQSSWNVIPGATSKNYSTGSLTETISFRRVIVYNGSTFISNEITVTVLVNQYPDALPSSGNNYIQTTTYTSASGQNGVHDITYTDGFDRPLQEISVGGKDIVQVYEYGLFGRTEKDYLPFAKSSNSGAFVSDAYDNSNWSIYSTDQAYAFAKTEYDGLTLDRVVKQTDTEL